MTRTQAYVTLLCITLFLVPSNLFLKFFESTAYVNGIFVDYLIPKLYLSDLSIVLILGLWSSESLTTIKHLTFPEKKLWPVIGVVSLLVLRQFFTSYPLASLWYLFKIIEMLLFGWFLITHRQLVTDRRTTMTLMATLIFQSFLAIYQYFTQSTLFGYWFLGEPNLSNPIGLARITLNGVEKTLPYGTTAHPNILGGVLALYLLLLTKTLKDRRQLFFAYLIGGPALFLTYSISAWLTLLAGLGTLVLSQKIKLGRPLVMGAVMAILLTPPLINLLAHRFPDSSSLVRRAYLNEAAIKMFEDNFWWGVGLNNFTSRVEEYTTNREVVRFIQPVHHLGYLLAAETGVFSLALAVSVLFYLVKQKSKTFTFLDNTLIVCLVPIMVLDHYLVTTQTGLLLLVIFLAYHNRDRLYLYAKP